MQCAVRLGVRRSAAKKEAAWMSSPSQAHRAAHAATCSGVPVSLTGNPGHDPTTERDDDRSPADFAARSETIGRFW